MNTIINADCLVGMKDVKTGSIDMILTDLPYGLTDAYWDNPIDLHALWREYERVIKPNGSIVLFCCQPFTSELIMSNKAWFSHSWVWVKNTGTGFLNANRMPLRIHEDIAVFSNPARYEADNAEDSHEGLRLYFKSEKEKTGLSTKEINELLNKKQIAELYFTDGKRFKIPSKANYEKLQLTGHFNRDYKDIKTEYNSGRQITPVYNPQFTAGDPYVSEREERKYELYNGKFGANTIINSGSRFPVSALYFDIVRDGLHPTQKPVELCEYLIKTYSNPGDLILDSCMGSGTTVIACINTGRKYIAFEKYKDVFDIAENRIIYHT